MKIIVKQLETIGVIAGSIIGGFIMYLIGEQESLSEIWNDPKLIQNLTISIISVNIFLRIALSSMRWPLRLVPFKQRKLSYYIRLGLCHFVFCGTLLLLVAVLIAYIVLLIFQDTSIMDTAYFKGEIYFVWVAILCLQVVFFMINMMLSLTWPEDPIWEEDWSDNLVYEEEEDYKELLHELQFLRSGLQEEIRLLPAGYVQDVEGISTEDIAYIFSFLKIRELRTVNGEKFSCDSRTVLGWAALLSPEDFFLAGRHLLISRRAVKSVHRLPNYKLELELEPTFEHKRTLSEEVTKEFKSWYYSGDEDREHISTAVCG